MSSTPRKYNYDDPEAARQASMTHGIYSIRDRESYQEKLARFKSEPGREDARAELAVVLWDMFQAWKAHLHELSKNGPEAVLTAPVNRHIAVYWNLLFRLIDRWPTSSDGAHALELERIQKVIEEHERAS